MKLKTFTLSVLFILTCAFHAAAQRSLLSNYGVSLNAGTGLGATGSVALHKNFTARAGFGFMPFSDTYTVEGIEYEAGGYTTETQPIDLKAKINVPAAHVMLDYNPFKNGMGAFHVTAGLFMGGTKLAHVDGWIDPSDMAYINQIEVEIGDALIRPESNGYLEAYAEVNAVKPYLGVGWGNAIPKRRVGFRFDIGALYQGKPEIKSPTLEGVIDDSDVEGIDKVLGVLRFYPQLSFQLTFRLLKDK